MKLYDEHFFHETFLCFALYLCFTLITKTKSKKERIDFSEKQVLSFFLTFGFCYQGETVSQCLFLLSVSQCLYRKKSLSCDFYAIFFILWNCMELYDKIFFP